MGKHDITEPATEKRGRGRPVRTAISKKMTKILCDALSKGASHNKAIELAGISRTTFYKYRQLGQKQQTGIYREFVDQVLQAEKNSLTILEDTLRLAALGGYIVTETKRVYKAGGFIEETIIERKAPPNGQLCLAILSKRDPKKWGQQSDLFEDRPLEFRIMGAVGLGTSPLPTDIETEED